MSEHPALADLLTALEAGVRDLEPAEAPAVVTRLGAILATAGARLATPPHANGGDVPDRTVTVKRVHEITTMSVDWIYRKAKAGALPFARPIGRKWVFSAAGLAKWLRGRAP